ncbi:hypothetical protein [Streptomyces acidicola]|uniref:Uncharacterized protein n=1 Tax=Streptomyces acidicola TaxID=2596892 RepID=A0A5N8WNZ1_9ACTN|nr:hypothetical protein [Streptomyces acidicola]MPY48862.1 hypothetical protein [Streptomyces acidicola]
MTSLPLSTDTGLSRRRMLLGAGLTAGALLGALPGASRAAAAPAARSGKASVYDVVVAAGSVTAPAKVPAGPVSFRVSTPTEGGMGLPLVQLRVPIDKYLDDLTTMTNAPTPDEAAAAAAVVESEAVNLGGAAVQPGIDAVFTQILWPGTYYFIAYDFDSSERPVAHRLTVEGVGRGEPPVPVDVIRHTPSGFWVSGGGQLHANGTHLCVNDSGVLNEAVLLPVRPGTTAAEVDAFFAALRDGTPPPSYPIIGGAAGSPPLSPGRSARVGLPLRPGGYVLSSWITSTTTGRPRAFDGFYKLVTLA